MLRISTRPTASNSIARVARALVLLCAASPATLAAANSDQPADDLFIPLRARLAALSDRLDPERNFGRPNVTDFRGCSLAMLLDYGQALLRRQMPEHAPVLEIAKRQCRELEKLALGREDRGEAPFVFRDGHYLGLVNSEVGFLFWADDRTARLAALYHGRRKHHFLQVQPAESPLWEVAYRHSEADGPKFTSQMPARLTADILPGELEAEIRLAWEFERPGPRVQVRWRLETISRLAHARIDVTGRQPASGAGHIAFPLVGRIGLEAPSAKSLSQNDPSQVERPSEIELPTGSGTGSKSSLVLPWQGGRLCVDPGRKVRFQHAAEMQFLAYYTDHGAGLLLQAEDPKAPSPTAIRGYRPQPEPPPEPDTALALGPDGRQLLAQGDSGLLSVGLRYPLPEAADSGQTCACGARVGCFSGDWFDAAQLYRTWALKQPWTPAELLWARRDVPVWLKRNCYALGAQGDPAKTLTYVRQVRSQLDAPGLLYWAGSGEALRPAFERLSPALSEMKLPWVASLSRPDEGETDILLQAVRQYGLRGLCLDGFVAGVGSLDAQRALLQRIRAEGRKIHPEFVLLLRGCDERFLDLCDGYLSALDEDSVAAQPAAAVAGQRIPLFATVYGDHCLRCGVCPAGEESQPATSVCLGQSLAWGEQIGLNCATVGALASPAECDARLAHVRWRHAALDYLAYGRMLRPPRLEMETDPAPASASPPVVAAAWQAPGDAVALVFVHGGQGTGPASFTASADWEEYGAMLDGSWQLGRLSPQGQVTRLQAVDPQTRVRDSLNPGEARILLLLPDPAHR